MGNSNPLAGAMLAAAMLVPPIAAAQDADTKEVLAYVLTDAGLAKYTAATKKLAALPAAACNEDQDSMSIDDMVVQLNAAPGAQAAIQSAGMATREYVLFTWSIGYNGLAAWALSQPGGKLPAGASKANVDFYNRHEAELQQLEGPKDDGCDGDQAEEETAGV